MAILQSSLSEELLSRQERSVLRGILRAAQLSEALKTLHGINTVATTEPCADVVRERQVILGAYLNAQIASALMATKAPVPTFDASKARTAKEADE